MPAPFSNVCQLKDYTCVMTTHYLMICLIIPESKFSSLTLIFYINHWIRKSCLVTSFVFNYTKRYWIFWQAICIVMKQTKEFVKSEGHGMELHLLSAVGT